MKDERTVELEAQVKFAEKGKQVLNNEAFKQALIARRAQIFDVFCHTKQEQSDVREEAWRTMQNMSALEKYFNNILTTGKMAEQSLESINEQNSIG